MWTLALPLVGKVEGADACFPEAAFQFDRIGLPFLLSIFFAVRDPCLLVDAGKAGVGQSLSHFSPEPEKPASTLGERASALLAARAPGLDPSPLAAPAVPGSPSGRSALHLPSVLGLALARVCRPGHRPPAGRPAPHCLSSVAAAFLLEDADKPLDLLCLKQKCSQ